MRLKLAIPEKEILDEEIIAVTLPGIEGQMTILPGHAMLVSELAQGELHYKKLDKEGKEQKEFYKIGPGFVEIQKDNVLVLVSIINRPNQ